ncbi:hypothetical protein Tco_1003376 [Tanacetum coccineum]|uniref:Uncharacterized protein n=1 Tax=Tanacetum coccineum TaxID=301880 RepID=A0ABQ5FA99_9ASTR
MLIEFVIQNQFFSYTLEEFAQMLDIPCEGACVFTDKWSLDELAYDVPRDGPYQTNPPSPDDIISYIRNDREGLTRKDYGTRRGRHSTSSPSAFDQPSSSHLNDDDDDDGNDEGTSRASTPSPTCFVNSLTNELRDEHRGGLRSIGKGLKNLWRNMKKNDEDVTTIPSPITTSSSPSLPNAPSKTTSTKDTSSTFGTTSSLFKSKPQSLSLNSNDTPSPQPSNPFLENVMVAPPRPSHPLPL